MGDALEDLKAIGLHMHTVSKAMNRAIREIERLTSQNARLRESISDICEKAENVIAAQHEENIGCAIERLDAALDSSWNAGIIERSSSPNPLPEQRDNIGKEGE